MPQLDPILPHKNGLNWNPASKLQAFCQVISVNFIVILQLIEDLKNVAAEVMLLWVGKMGKDVKSTPTKTKKGWHFFLSQFELKNWILTSWLFTIPIGVSSPPKKNYFGPTNQKHLKLSSFFLPHFLHSPTCLKGVPAFSRLREVFGCQDTLTRTSSLAFKIIFCRSSAELCRLEPPLTRWKWPKYSFPKPWRGFKIEHAGSRLICLKNCPLGYKTRSSGEPKNAIKWWLQCRPRRNVCKGPVTLE